MYSPRRSTNYFALGLLALLSASCTSQMQPAQNAIDAINDTIVNAKDAPKYAPDQLTSAQNHLAELKAYFAKQDYSAVIDHASAVLDEANALEPAATAKRDQLRAGMITEYNGLSASMPKELDTVQTHLYALIKSGRKPKGVDMTAAKSDFDDATTQWKTAQSVYKSGTIEDALDSARGAKSKLDAAATDLKLDLTKPAS